MAIIGPKGGVGNILGLQALQEKLLRKIPAAAKAHARQALAQNADELVGMMQRMAPVGPPSHQQQKKGAQPGALRDSIVATWGGDGPSYAAFQGGARRRNRHKMAMPGAGVDDDLRVVVTAGNSAVRYAHMVEFGTAPHAQPNNPRMGYKHPGAKAQPFFYPSYRALRKAMKARVNRAIKRGITEGSK